MKSLTLSDNDSQLILAGLTALQSMVHTNGWHFSSQKIERLYEVITEQIELQDAGELREHVVDIAHGNTGHGHVYPRPDGLKARCGGPALCADCARDQGRRNTAHAG